MDIKRQLTDFCRRYPLMRTQDYIKLIFQSEYYGGHFIASEDDSLRRLKKEAELCVVQKVPQEPAADFFLEMARVNIRPFVRAGKNLNTLNRIFVESNRLTNGNRESFDEKLNVFLQLVKEKKIDLPYYAVSREVSEYKKSGYPIPNHSSAVKMNYAPAYRVIKKEYWQLFDVIEKIDKLLNSRLTVTVAIDGNSGAGKSFFSQALKDYYGCQVLHTDDFFLPPSLKSKERLDEAGGNVHYERLRETMIKMKDAGGYEYDRYDCGTGEFKKVVIPACRLNIVEGCYSLHRSVKDMYDLAVIVKVNKAVQTKRILKRDGAEKLKRYVNEWIPLEDKYFSALDTTGVETMTIDTSKEE